MRRVVVAVTAGLLFCGATQTDWKYYGTRSSTDGDLIDFFEVNGIKKLSDGHRQVWVKTLSAKKASATKLTRPEIDQAVGRSKGGYRPPFEVGRPLPTNQHLVILAMEAQANSGVIQPEGQILWDLDCPNNTARTLSVILHGSDGNITTSDQLGAVMHAPPESSLASLVDLVCKI